MSEDPLQAYGELATGVREILLPPNVIQDRVQELARAVSEEYAGLNPLLVGVLKGVLFFMADLLRAMTIPAEVDFMAVSSYSAQSRDQGLVRLEKDLEVPLAGRHVLFVEDVIDTGLTLNYLLRTLRARQPTSLEVCVLFDKPQRRLVDIPLKYTGFDLPSRFVVGYGLDYRERYRSLPFVGVLDPSVLRDHRSG